LLLSKSSKVAAITVTGPHGVGTVPCDASGRRPVGHGACMMGRGRSRV
jgi:hypothetical protein